ncbi:MAG: hypothetical protein ABI559_07725 [Chloroflexota bacterium]
MLGITLAISVARSPASSASPADGATGTAAAGGFDKIAGKTKGTYHLSFPDYNQVYEIVTTADITWTEDPSTAPFGCHCRTFFPTGSIDWTANYATDQCSATDHGHLEAGVGLSQREEQMLVLWEDPDDPTHYFYSANGQVSDEAFFDCDGGFTITVPDFIDVAAPDFRTPTPTPAAALQDASPPSCDEEFSIPRDATRIAGSCYSGSADIPFDPYDYTKFEWDFGPEPEPIIFIHGFLGSQIKCGGDELWPHIPPSPDFPEMSLASDGISPAAGACAATVGDIVETVLGSHIYKDAVDFLNQLEPGNVEFFNWDWRESPEQSLLALNTKIHDVRAAHNDSKVVLMAHSYGGLLARLYVDDAGRAENVARVLTIGTPALGSPKAIFPLYAGVETPEFSTLDLLMNDAQLHEFARNLFGAYFLYPSPNYGPWLTVGPNGSASLGQQGVLDYVTQMGGNAALLEHALNLHASVLDPPYIGRAGAPKFEVIVGTGKPTISGVHVLPDGELSVDYTNGDGTVPARSAARGVLGSGNPNKAHTHYSCYVDHVALPGDPQITDAVKGYLQFGDDIQGLSAPCSANGLEAQIFDLPPIAASADSMTTGISGQIGALSIDDAVLQGVVDYLDLPKQKFVIAGTEMPLVTLPPGKFLKVTPLLDDGKGQPVIYGPLGGSVTMSSGAGGSVVTVDGHPAPLDGDVNCDGKVTTLDALLLLLASGGTPKPQPDGCAQIGSGANAFGDLDCNNSVTANDGLDDLRLVAGASLDFLAGCLSSANSP